MRIADRGVRIWSTRAICGLLHQTGNHFFKLLQPNMSLRGPRSYLVSLMTIWSTDRKTARWFNPVLRTGCARNLTITFQSRRIISNCKVWNLRSDETDFRARQDAQDRACRFRFPFVVREELLWVGASRFATRKTFWYWEIPGIFGECRYKVLAQMLLLPVILVAIDSRRAEVSSRAANTHRCQSSTVYWWYRHWFCVQAWEKQVYDSLKERKSRKPEGLSSEIGLFAD
jgi:hypothetical protein